jgi:hypothetical protein
MRERQKAAMPGVVGGVDRRGEGVAVPLVGEAGTHLRDRRRIVGRLAVLEQRQALGGV